MRYAYIALVVVLSAIVVLFKFQNLDTVTVSLFNASVTMPISILVTLVYVFGALTGGVVYSFLRGSIRGATAEEWACR